MAATADQSPSAGYQHARTGVQVATALNLAESAVQPVDLTPELREAIKLASPHAQLIAQRVIDRIRARYPLDEELYFARIAVGALQGTYTLLEGEAAALAQYQLDVEAAREWGRQARAELGL